jgi:hypothetical protein
MNRQGRGFLKTVCCENAAQATALRWETALIAQLSLLAGYLLAEHFLTLDRRRASDLGLILFLLLEIRFRGFVAHDVSPFVFGC